MIYEAAITALLFALLSAGRSKAKPGGGTSPKGPTPGGPSTPTIPTPTPDKPKGPTGPSGPTPTPGGPKPTPTPKPKPIVLKPGWKSWGTLKPASEYFRIGDETKHDNFIMIAKDCSGVIEGPMFRPFPDDVDVPLSAVEASTLAAVLALEGHENTAWGFIDWLEGHGYDASDSVDEVVKAVAPMCASVGSQFWASPMRAWYQDFVTAVGAWREGIEFGGDNA